jgi:hypothetical protein
MAEHPIVVTIDTCTFENLNFNWDHEVLLHLCQWIEAGKVHLVLTAVVVEEVRRRLGVACNQAQSLGRQLANSLRKTGAAAPELPEPSVEEAHRAFYTFLDQADVEILDAEGLNLQDLVSQWIESERGFSSKKKNQFQDAISLIILEHYGLRTGCQVFFCSDDGDWDQGASESEALKASRLGSFLNKLVHEEAGEERLLTQFEEALKSEKGALTEAVRASIAEIWPMVDHWDGDAKDLAIEGLDLLDLDVIELDQDARSATIAISGSALLSAHARFPDEATATWDSEDKVPFYHHHIDTRLEQSFDVEATALVRLDTPGGRMELVELSNNLGDNLVFQTDPDPDY